MSSIDSSDVSAKRVSSVPEFDNPIMTELFTGRVVDTSTAAPAPVRQDVQTGQTIQVNPAPGDILPPPVVTQAGPQAQAYFNANDLPAPTQMDQTQLAILQNLRINPQVYS